MLTSKSVIPIHYEQYRPENMQHILDIPDNLHDKIQLWFKKINTENTEHLVVICIFKNSLSTWLNIKCVIHDRQHCIKYL